MRFVWRNVVVRQACAAQIAFAAVLKLTIVSGGLTLVPLDAVAGNCAGTGAPNTIGAQNDTVELDTDCAGAGGTVTVSGDVTGEDLGSGRAVIHDQPGNE